MELRDLPVITHYRNLTLDGFQRRAIAHIEAGRSVLVSAPTGTGKTLVADYVIEKMYRDGRRVVYTAPIKALSNQKYKEFKALLGEAHVGILTGDIVINPEATVLIMTTEIFRNLLHVDVERLADVGYVVFDEIHYIDDPVRGSVWEESLIFMPPAMRFLGLSATIPNCEELAAWAEQVHGQEVAVVRHDERAVPLSHHLFERQLGLCNREQLLKRFKRYAQRFGVTDAGRLKARFEPTTHLDLIEVLKDGYLPCLYFTFSRRRCEIHASELGARKGLLASEARAQIAQVIERQTKRYNGVGESRLRAVEPLLMRGIAYHHAGLLPLVKDV
ncbi:MAG TPA: DEAD/DEAH box helicase, partial [Limnochordia bacterium]|nr:DEAD/DEAH box helicase [Limnochordia bacterium]